MNRPVARLCNGLRACGVLLALLLAACGDDDGVAAPRPTPTATPIPATPTTTPTFAGTPVIVRRDEPLGPTNGRLLGVGWNTGNFDALAPFVPAAVRIDSHLDSVSPARGEWRFESLLEAVAAVRAGGSEPMVILYPMPAWLGEASVPGCPPPGGLGECSPRHVAPADFAAWEEVIARVVHTLATAPQPALRFEIWNEPDGTTFWHDSPEAFRRTAVASHRAVARVAAATGLKIEVGGPASTLIDLRDPRRPNVDFLAAYVEAVVAAGQPLDFVSWHWYANTPLLGPDGNEGFIDEASYRLLAGINPRATPRVYGEIVDKMRTAIAPFLAGANLAPPLVADEWNISAGGYDRRNDSHVGAAFVAAGLIEMERAGLDAAYIYRAVSDAGRVGDWGIVGANGERKPNWWVFHAWRETAGTRLRIDADDPAGGFWARAVDGRDAVHVLLSTFRASGPSARAVDLVFDGDCDPRDAEVATIDADSPSFESFVMRPLEGRRLSLRLGDQSATWVRLRCS